MSPRPTLMLVDDEARILRSLAMLFRGAYDVRMTTDAREALTMLDAAPAQVVISDQRMPIMSGAAFLREVRQRSPQSMRLLLTGYSELDAVVASVNEGEIFRFIHKPWDAANLRQTVDEAARIALSLTAPVDPGLRQAHAETVLVIDDDPEVALAVKGLLGESVTVHDARSIDAAMALIDAHPVGVIVSDLVVGGEHVAGMLKGLKAQRPAPQAAAARSAGRQPRQRPAASSLAAKRARPAGCAPCRADTRRGRALGGRARHGLALAPAPARHRRLSVPADQWATVFENTFITTTPATIRLMPISAAASSRWPNSSHAATVISTTPRPAQMA